MNIVFYNFHHSGDLFFMKEIIHVITQTNPEHKFYLSTDFCAALYTDVNIVILPAKYVKQVVVDKEKYYYHTGHNILYIDTWVGKHKFNGIDIESVHHGFITIINDISTSYAICPSLKYNIIDYCDIVPNIPNMIDLSNLLPSDRKLIFYYNVDSLSGQCPNYNHNYIISCLSSYFPSHHIIVAKECDLNLPNITVLSQYITETPTGENLLVYAHLAGLCDYVIMKDCGACFYYFNRQNMLSNRVQNIILVSIRSELVHSLSKFLLNDSKKIHDVQLSQNLHLDLRHIITQDISNIICE
jgi:hypothetical protein